MKKTCRTCGNDFDDTPANFKPNQRTGGLSTQCRTCLRAQRRKASARKAERRQQQLARLEVGGIERLISAAASGGSSVPHTAELLEQIMQYFGGVSGFSALFVKQYFEAQAGGSFRTKMLDTVARLISKNTELGGAKKPLTLWSEEELESELNALDGEIKSKSDILKERETVSLWFKFWWHRRPRRFSANYYQYNFLSLEIEDAGIGGHGER